MTDRHPYLDGPHPRRYAHRGWHIGPLAGCENTLAAFEHAVAEGVHYIEMDVHSSADGVPMVHHDPVLDRTTDSRGALARLPAAQIEDALVAGREPVPRLESVLAGLPETRFTIELKSAEVVLPTLAVLERLDAWHRVCLGSFSETWLQRARAGGGPRLLTSMGMRSVVGLRSRAWLDAVPELPVLSRLPGSGLLRSSELSRSFSLSGLAGPLLPAVRGGLAQIPRHFGPLTVVDPVLLRRAHAAGIEVHVWTVDEPTVMRELLDLGVDGLLSDRPDLLLSV